MEIVGLITAALAALPVILELIKMVSKTPAEKRAAALNKIHAAITHARENPGDTSKIEDIIRND